MTKVRCKVNSCYYWGEGEVCQAANISVINNLSDEASIEAEYADEMSYAFDTGVDYEMGIGMQANQELLNEMIANTSQQTQCETMRPRHG